MVKVYSISLVLGIIGLLMVILGGSLAELLGREEGEPTWGLGAAGKPLIGGFVGFGMAGLSAEFSTFDLSWPAALVIAIVGAVAAALWAVYGSRTESRSDAGPL